MSDEGATRLSEADQMGVVNLDYYDEASVVSLKSFFICHGAVFTKAGMWIDVLVVLMFYCGFMSAYKNIPGAADQIGDFDDFLGTVSSFLFVLVVMFMCACLGARTAITNDIGAICGALRLMTATINQLVTDDPKVTQLLQRWTRASLYTVFLEVRFPDDLEGNAQRLKEWGLLTSDECNIVTKTTKEGDAKVANMAESIYGWHMAMLSQFVENDMIPAGWVFHYIIKRIFDAQDTVGHIHFVLGNPPAYKYVHLLGFLKAVYLIMLAFSSAMTAAVAYEAGDMFQVSVITLKVLSLTIFLTAVLLVSLEIGNPFDADLTDFPMQATCDGYEGDNLALTMALNKMPSWTKKGFAPLYKD